MRANSFVGKYVSSISWVAPVLLVLVISSGILAAPNPFAEVPAGHWTYHALERMHTLGLIERPRQRTAHLNWQVTRIEMAIEVADVLDTLVRVSEDSQHSLVPRLVHRSPVLMAAIYNERVEPERMLLEADIRILQDLVVQFQPELEALGYRFESVAVQAMAGPDALARALARYQMTSDRMLETSGQIRSNAPALSNVLAPSPENDYLLYPQIDPIQSTTGLPENLPPWIQENYQLLLSQQVADTEKEAILAQLGEVTASGWDELSLLSPEGLEGLQAAVKLGQLGSTVLLARLGADESNDFVAGLDSEVHLDRFSVGATVLRSTRGYTTDDEEEPEEGTLAGVQGSYRLTPGVVVSAGLAGSIWGDRDAGLVRVGGVLHLSERVSLEAVYRLQGAGFRRALSQNYDPERSGLDVAFDLGDTKWTAGVDRATWLLEDRSTVTTTTSVGLLYPVNELTIFRASREEVHQAGDLDPGEPERSYTTALGVDFFLPKINMNVKLGYALVEEWGEDTALGLQGRASETALGVEYQLPSGSIALKYTVTEVSGDVGNTGEQGPNVGAEIAIRF